MLETEYAIIGGGPAGVQLGYQMQEAGLDYAILEGSARCGAFFGRFPRHRKLISINKLYTGYSDRERRLRWDWNSILGSDDDPLFSAYSREYFPAADDYVRYIDDFARRHRLNVRFNTRVHRISRDEGGGYRLSTNSGEIRARRIVVATGLALPHIPDIEGIELTEPYTTMPVEENSFTDQRVLILGKGNSAFETADALTPAARMIHMVSPRPVEFAWRSHFVGHLRAVNNNFLDTYQLKSQNAVLDATIQRIWREPDGLHVLVDYTHNAETEELVYDRILNCTGFRFDGSIFDADCRPQLRHCGRLPEQTSAWESTNLEGLYFAGALTQARDYKRTTSAFIHGFRYNVRALFKILQERHHGTAWPSRPVEATPEAATQAALERINTSSGLWQQFGFLGDIIRVGDAGLEYYEEVPLAYAMEHPRLREGSSFVVTLEYGDKKMVDPFNQANRVVRTDSEEAARSAFLHPVVRHYEGGELRATHHVIEDLAAEWWEPEHVEPLRAFFEARLVAEPGTSYIRELSTPDSAADRAKEKVS